VKESRGGKDGGHRKVETKEKEEAKEREVLKDALSILLLGMRRKRKEDGSPVRAL
jgi:hypothetical protein